MTSEADRRVLLQLARRAIVAHVAGGGVPTPISLDVLGRAGGVFVTLHKQGGLRGCIGQIEADESLGVLIPRCAIAACSTDPRFPPVSVAELLELEVELSLLGTPELIAGPADFEIGLHGLLVERGWHRGLLLPQVATERRWDREEFLTQACHKAGLRGDAWKEGATTWRFEAEVFGEWRLSTTEGTEDTLLPRRTRRTERNKQL